MQQRHLDRKLYFQELANTSRDFYLDYLRPYINLGEQTRVLEIGCGEGGNLLPFAEIGCQVKGIDLSETRIRQAREFFAEAGQNATFACENFIHADQPATEADRYDLILIHDVIEHIEKPYKLDFFTHIRPFLKQNGLLFIGFPAWQMPFGGHQQICKGFAAKMPFIHLLPKRLYAAIVRSCGNGDACVNELLSIKRAKMPIEPFERLTKNCGYTILQRTLWFVNPHYKQKFGLKPRKENAFFARLKYIRNFYTTSAFYLLRSAE